MESITTDKAQRELPSTLRYDVYRTGEIGKIALEVPCTQCNHGRYVLELLGTEPIEVILQNLETHSEEIHPDGGPIASQSELAVELAVSYPFTRQA
jgi:hypothetical protein